MANKKELTEEQKTTQAIADNISKLSDSVSALLNGPLNRKALLILLVASTRMTRRQVNDVLVSLEHLKKDYLK